MPKRVKVEREPVTHDELISLYNEYKRVEHGPRKIAEACKNRLEGKFKLAIDEARTMGVLALTILTDLRKLKDPESEESVCPAILTTHLGNTIAQFAAIEKKEMLKIRRATPIEA